MQNRIKITNGTVKKDGTPVTVLPEGTVLSRGYRVRWEGANGRCFTYKAVREGKLYLIREVHSSDIEAVSALKQQQFVLEQVSHPGIQRYVEMFNEGGWQYLVLEQVSGTSLEKIISRDPTVFMDEKTLFEWASQLYDLFTYLHQRKGDDIYGDIIVKKVIRSPKNIMRDEEGAFHLLDVGASSYHDNDTAPSQRVTALQLFAAPEILEGREIDERSDVFTIGAILYYLLSNGRGREPETGRFLPLSQINRNVSPQLEALVMKAVMDDPGERFPFIMAMKAEHSVIVTGKPAVKEREEKKALAGKLFIPAICTTLALVMILIVAGALSSGKRSSKQQVAISKAGHTHHQSSPDPSNATKPPAPVSNDPMLYPESRHTPVKKLPTLPSPSSAASPQSTLSGIPSSVPQKTEAPQPIASSHYPTAAPQEAIRAIAPAPSSPTQEGGMKGISSIPRHKEDILAELFSVDRKKITAAPKNFNYYEDFSFKLPDNYCLITESDSYICFAAIDERKGESSLRVIQIKIRDFPQSAGSNEEAWRYYKLSLINNGASFLDEKPVIEGGGYVIGFSGTYKWIPPSPLNNKINESYMHQDHLMIIGRTSHGKERKIFIFMASAPESTYDIYEKSELSPSLESIYFVSKRLWME